MTLKRRLSASIDADLLQAAEEAVARGEASTVSAWVNDALRLKLVHDQKLAALAEYIAAFEAEHGAISAGEMRAAARGTRARAVVVRGNRLGERRAPSRRRASR